jgi:hypothetical protein
VGFALYAAAEGYLALAVDFAANLSAPLAGASSDARRARVLSRLAACDRLRVFFRALVFGIGEVPSSFRIEISKRYLVTILRRELPKLPELGSVSV